ncbi:hypothetical protein KHQ81_10065 [Mycoplasmatota bacterium]|nr:hypothetical protein KHQ81_10065 [Mycoplasmatota bacterium]
MKIGQFVVYRSYYNSQNHICKLASTELITEDDTHTYYLTYTGCDLELGYYIKEDNKFIKLSEAFEKNLITFDEINSLEILYKQEKQSD